MTALTHPPAQSTDLERSNSPTTMGWNRRIREAARNTAAMLGMVLSIGLIVLTLRSDLRSSAEQHLLSWLLDRQETLAVPEDAFDSAFVTSALERVTAAEPTDLPKAQANVAFWLSRKYRVAPEPLSVLVAEAFAIGQRIQIDPSLILAVMAVESRFNPFAQSAVGAQGLMQVMTRVHTDKYEDFGGQLAAFDPVTNLRVGVQVLQDCIKRAGSVEGGLRLYVGAVTSDGSDYINKVMAEHQRIQSVAQGKSVPVRDSAAQPAMRAQPEGAPKVTSDIEALEAEAIAPRLNQPLSSVTQAS